MANINKIRLSGQTYNIEDVNATKTVELTQAQYDALAVKDPNTFYIITDSEGFDLSNYYTKSETSGATQISTALASKADKSEIPSLDGYATETWVEGKGYLTEHQDISGKLDVSAFNTYSGSVNTQLNSKALESDLNALNDTVTAHTANASIHVTAVDKAAWNAKSDFSGSYNDLTDKPTIPTVPTSNTAFTNDAGYITSSALNGYATTGDVQTAITAATSTKQDTLISGTNIKTINNESILGSGNIDIQGGGGKELSGGTNISITTGETADTINCTLPYYIDSGNCWTIFGDSSANSNKSTGTYDSVYIGYNNEIKNTNISITRKTQKNILIGWNNKLDSYYNSSGLGFNAIIGHGNTLSGSNNIRESYVIGSYNTGHTSYEFICGWSNEVRNSHETSFGYYNNSVSASTTFGDSGNTLFSVGNGTVDARHNAFEIRQNGDIYCSDGTNDVKLQDTITATAANTTALGGLSLVKLTQSEYDALATKDSNTLYVING